MSSYRAHHRYSMAITAVLTTAMGILLLVLGTAEDADGRGVPPIGDGTGGVEGEEIGTFDLPVNVAFAPGEPLNLYVVEQDGLVKVVENGGAPQTFLNAQGLTDGNGEQGLLGIAFHPNYQANDLLYAYYTDEDNGDIVVSEYRAPDAGDADETSRRKVIRIRHRFASNHNGGQLLFGPDGFLYMGTGDGGDGGDPRENAQDKRSLLGKLLRINPLDPPGAREFRSPAGNPFKRRKGKDPIYARGLRNPFRFTFDSLTSRIAIGDVGQDRFEEIDYETQSGLRNANFGWDRYEGFKRYNGGDSARTPKRKRHDRPIHVYSHSRGCSITGGLVVRDENLDTLYGRYLYADFCEARLRSVVPKLSRAEADRVLGLDVPQPTAFAEDPATHEVYVTSHEGPVYRLVPGM